MAPEKKKDIVPELRKESRYAYLQKREPQKLQELKLAIQDEEYLFRDEKLTDAEKRELELQKKIYQVCIYFFFLPKFSKSEFVVKF